MPKFFVKEDETYSSCVRVYLGDPESEESTEILCIWKNDKILDQMALGKSIVNMLENSGFVDRHPVITLQFLVTPDSALDGQSPLQALALGGRWAEAVERLARAHQGDGFA